LGFLFPIDLERPFHYTRKTNQREMRSPRKERQDINVPGSKGKGINPKMEFIFIL
jgi:hypothetical protein